MDIILLKDVEQLGFRHDVVKVKAGFGRNFLIPKGIAILANPANKEKLDKIKSKEQEAELAKIDDYKAMATDLEGKTLKIGVKTGTSGKIFGSVTNIQIMNALKEQCDLEVDRRKIEISEEIKEMGTYSAALNLHPDVQTSIDFELVAE